MTKSVSIYTCLFGVLTGLLFAVTPGTVLVIAVFFATVLFIRRRIPEEERDFVTWIIITAFVVRIALAVIMHAHSYLAGFDGFISGDERLYTIKGWDLLLEWRGDLYGAFIKEYKHGINPFTYILTVFYGISGFNAVAAKFINCYIGALTAFAVYDMTSVLFGRHAGRLSLVIVAFWPSMVRWSASALKDPLIILLIVLIIGLFIRIIRKRKAVMNTLIAVAAILILGLLQRSLLAVMLICLAGALIFSFINIRIRGAKEFTAVFFAITIASVIMAVALSFTFKGKTINFLKDCVKHQISVAVSDNAGYTIFRPDLGRDLDKGYIRLSDIFPAYLKGFAYFLLSPFPWAIRSLSQLAAYPQVILWYFSLLLFCYGFAKGGGVAAKETAIIGFFILLFVSINSLAEGNIGAAFRHRDYISPLVFVYVSYALAVFWRAPRHDRIKV